MTTAGPIYGVLLSETMDLKSYYALDFGEKAPDVCLLNPDEVTDLDAIRFAVCWLPGPAAFAPYPNLEMAMSVGAGVDDLLGHPGLHEGVAICRVRDPHQAHLMAGYAVHEVVHFERGFAQMQQNQAQAQWAPPPIRPPSALKVAVFGHGSMGAVIVRALVETGFCVSVACRRPPKDQISGVRYFSGDDSVIKAATDMNVVINTLPLTAQTEDVLNADLFARLAKGAWLIQIGRGEHLAEADFVAALESGQLSGATLDVFREEPLPSDHPFWRDPRLRITPHVASDTTPAVVAEQALQSARELLAGTPLSLAVNPAQGY
ncbi:NAD(P)-dependent oxidoreductase [Thalassospira australica]|uniref:NAD(P)-dependent oxidoreductase n=1 Tax=Thalassospira australica TaxID=1528106 RepID=UPI00051A4C7E|nr:NAD(P)-dependent oxidoreductase [Thalassospira australica]